MTAVVQDNVIQRRNRPKCPPSNSQPIVPTNQTQPTFTSTIIILPHFHLLLLEANDDGRIKDTPCLAIHGQPILGVVGRQRLQQLRHRRQHRLRLARRPAVHQGPPLRTHLLHRRRPRLAPGRTRPIRPLRPLPVRRYMDTALLAKPQERRRCRHPRGRRHHEISPRVQTQRHRFAGQDEAPGWRPRRGRLRPAPLRKANGVRDEVRVLQHPPGREPRSDNVCVP